MDQTAILQKAEKNSGFVTVTVMFEELGWEANRSQRSLDQLVKEGLAWIDSQAQETQYWIPSIYTSLII